VVTTSPGKVPVHVMKAYRRSVGTKPRILNLGISCEWVVKFTPRPLYPRERNPEPTEQKAGWVPESVWSDVEKMNILHCPHGEFLCLTSAKYYIYAPFSWRFSSVGVSWDPNWS
jgi:hypothetical protein